MKIQYFLERQGGLALINFNQQGQVESKIITLNNFPASVAFHPRKCLFFFFFKSPIILVLALSLYFIYIVDPLHFFHMLILVRIFLYAYSMSPIMLIYTYYRYMLSNNVYTHNIHIYIQIGSKFLS